MRLLIFPCLAALVSAGAPVARAQSLVSEEAQGNRRICNYDAGNTYVTRAPRVMQHSVGIAENCPVTYPLVNSGRPAPPTAALRSDRQTAERRTCTYEQWGSTWAFDLPLQVVCPPVAGLVQRSQVIPPDRLRPPAPAR